MRDVWRTVRGRHPVRFFTFHRVTDACRDGMTVNAKLFRRQLEYVLRTHQVVTLEESLELVQNGTRLRRPVAAITFDDGYLSVYQQAFPIMTELGVAGSCFLTTGLVGTEKRFPHDAGHPAEPVLGVMGWDEILALCMMGWTVGGHSMTHARLSQCEGKEARLELEHPIELLRLALGLKEIPWAFPFGGRDDFTADDVKAVRKLGYNACFSNHGGENVPPADPFDLKRIDIGGDHDTLAWKMMAHGISLDAGRGIWDRITANGQRP
jgi:peptidoglycan/xylan/chitin deacetylase (PgdA/CDA1 family)